MLEAICDILHGLSTVDCGAECVLNKPAYEGLMKLLKTVYGDHAAEVVRKQIVYNEQAETYTCPCEGCEEAFRSCLTGVA